MLKKILKFIWTIIILILIIIFFFAVIRPAYMDYKQSKKEVVVDTSGKRATSKNKVSTDDEMSSSDDNENRWRLERKDDYDPFTFDDRILLYEGEINSISMNHLVDILIEDIESPTYSKIDININGVDITYDNKENYSAVLNNFKNSISEGNMYLVEYEYSALRAVVNKVIITNI